MPRSSDAHALVFKAANEMLADGVRPSVDKIQKHTGTTASTKTLNDALNAYWLAVGERMNRPGLPEVLIDAVEAIWQSALDQADQALAEYRRVATEKAEAAEAERDASLARQNELAAELADQRRQTESLEADKRSLERRLAVEETQRRQAESAIESAQQTAAVAEAALQAAALDFEQKLTTEKARSDDLEKRLVAQLEEQRSLRVQAEKREQRLIKDNQTLVEARDRLREDAIHQATVVRASEAALAAAQAREDTLSGELVSLQQDLERRENGHRDKLQSVEQQHRELDRQLQAAVVAKAQAEREAEVLERQIDALAERLANVSNASTAPNVSNASIATNSPQSRKSRRSPKSRNPKKPPTSRR